MKKCFCGAAKENTFPFCAEHYFALPLCFRNQLLKTKNVTEKRRMRRSALKEVERTFKQGKAGRSITPATDFPGFSSSINQEEAAIYNKLFSRSN